MGAGQALEATEFAAPHVVEAPKLDIEPAQILRRPMAEMIAMDPLQRLQAAIRVLAVSYQLYIAHFNWHSTICMKVFDKLKITQFYSKIEICDFADVI